MHSHFITHPVKKRISNISISQYPSISRISISQYPSISNIPISGIPISTHISLSYILLISTYIFLSLCILFFPATTSAFTIGKTQINNIGLVGHWTFDGKDMPNGRVNDLSGQGNHGSKVNMATSTANVPGKIGQALRFDGVDDCVNTPYSLPASGAFTVSMWLKYTGSNAGTSFVWSQDVSGADITLGYAPSLGGFFYENELDVSDQSTIYGGNNYLMVNQWYHVVLVEKFTGDVDGNDFYVNGALVAGSSGIAGNPSNTTFKIGSRDTCTANAWGGMFDDVRIYNRALSAAEISALYKSGSAKTGITKTPLAGSTLTSGLVGHWTFDGKDMPNGRVSDLSGQGNHGSKVNMSTSTANVPGKIGQALRFDGVDDYVNAGSSSALDDISIITVSAWVKSRTAGESNIGRIVMKGTAGWTFNYNTGGAQVFSFFSGTDLNKSICGGLTHGEWTHWAFTWDGSTSRSNIHVYKNGSEVSCSGGQDATGTRDGDAAYDLTIGSDTSGGSTFDGLIDDVRIYNRALSAAEIKQLYALGGEKVGVTPSSGTNKTGLVGHWTFDGKDMPNGRVNDLSGQGNHGSKVNMATSTANVPGKIGQALRFDGVDDRVLISTVPTITQPYTVSVWFKFNDLGRNQHLITFGTGNPAPGVYISSNNKIEIDGVSAGTFRTFCNKTFTSEDIGKWFHVTAVVNSSTDASQWKCYLEGVDVGVNGSGSTGTYSDPPNTNWTIGNYPALSLRYFSGLIDDVRIYNRALSASEIKQLYNAGR